MSDTSANPPDGLDEIIADFLEAEEAGRPISAAELIAQHPEFADQLREFFADRDILRSDARPLAIATVVRRPVLDSIRYFGDYELLEEIARGGMGIVYKARQKSLNRLVAVKMILAGNLASEVDMQRFQSEAEAAARLQHPGIVSVHEVGRHKGRSYFSMDFVDGRNLSEVIREESLPPRRAAGYVEQIAQAVHYAHQQTTLHRDLKPSNVMIDENDCVRITDFGLALNIAADSQLTGTGQAVGTPAYMPPEQAEGERGRIGPECDVYAMGAILYELLTGRPPFRGETPVDVLRQAMETEPLSPRLLNRSVPKDLETICLKCLEKEPAGRYRSAGLLADDLQRFRNGEPISARPIGRMSRVWRWCRRKPLAAGLSAALLLSIVGTVVTLTTANLRINRALTDRSAALAQSSRDRQAAEDALAAEKRAVGEQNRLNSELQDALERTEWNAYLRGIQLSVNDEERGHLEAARTRLASCGPESLRGFEWHYLASRVSSPMLNEWSSRALRPPRAISVSGLALAEINGNVQVYDPREGRVVFRRAVPQDEYAHTISPDGRWAAFVSRKKIRNTIRVLSLHGESSRPLIVLPPDESVHDVLFSHDGGRVLALVEQSPEGLDPSNWSLSELTSIIRFFDAATAAPTATHRLANLPTRQQSIHRNLIAADDSLRWLITPHALFDLHASKAVLSFPEPAEAVALSRDAGLAAVATKEGNVTIWHATTGQQIDALFPGQRVRQLAFRPNASEVALGCLDGTVVFRDFASQRSLNPLPTGPHIRSLAFLPGGQHLLTIHSDLRGTLHYRLWMRNRDACLVVLPSRVASSLWGRQVCFQPDGRGIAIAGIDGTVSLLDARTGELTRSFQMQSGSRSQLSSVTFSPEGSTIVAAGREGFFVWDVESGKLLRVLDPETGTFCTQAAFSPDGRWLAGAHQNGLTIWDRESGRVEKAIRVGGGGGGCEFRSIGFSSDGAFLFATANRGQGRILNVSDWSLRCRLPDGPSSRGVLTPDNLRLAVPASREVRFYDTSTGQPLTSMHCQGVIVEVAFSPDGRRIAAASGNSVQLLDTATGDLVLTLTGHTRSVSALAFSSNGRRLVSVAHGGAVRIWGDPVDRE